MRRVLRLLQRLPFGKPRTVGGRQPVTHRMGAAVRGQCRRDSSRPPPLPVLAAQTGDSSARGQVQFRQWPGPSTNDCMDLEGRRLCWLLSGCCTRSSEQIRAAEDPSPRPSASFVLTEAGDVRGSWDRDCGIGWAGRDAGPDVL